MTFMSDDEREETILERRDRERAESGKVDNEETVPLIPNIKLDARRTITEIEVWKMDPPNDGFKGCVPTHTSLPAIAKLYGNGVYDFHAKTQDGKTLRRNAGVKVSWDDPNPKSPAEPPNRSNSPDMQLLEWQAKQHAADAKRVEDFGRMVVETTKETANNQISAITKQSEATSIRERDFCAGLLTQQQTFFQTMMLTMQQSHQHSMERSREDFQQTIQLIHAANERAVKSSDPSLLLSVFQQGLALASQNQSDDDEDSGEPWVEAIKTAAEAVKDITSTAKFKSFVVAKQQGALPSQNRPSNPASNPENKPETQPTNPPSKPAKKKIFTREEMAEIIRIKRIMDQQNLDFSATLRNASQYFAGGGSIDSRAQTGSTPEPQPPAIIDESSSDPEP